jgi:hypothetical protein
MHPINRQRRRHDVSCIPIACSRVRGLVKVRPLEIAVPSMWIAPVVPGQPVDETGACSRQMSGVAKSPNVYLPPGG